MAVIVEDGTVVTGSNSYASEDDLNIYAKAQGKALTTSKTQLLLNAMLWLETRDFIGFKYSKAQRNQWPRTDVVIDGFSYDDNEIPQILIDLQCEVAISIEDGNNPLAPVQRAIKSESVGPISTEYMDGASDQVMTPSIYAMANKLINGGSGGASLRLSRA